MHNKLLDANFLLNLIRTITLIEEHDDTHEIEFIYEKFRKNKQYNLITTSIVGQEVTKVIQSKSGNDFFYTKKDPSIKIKNYIFRNYIQFINIRDKDLAPLSTTSAINMGEKTLVYLYYKRFINYGIPTNIVSNDIKDVMSNLRKAQTIEPKMSKINLNDLVQSNYDFYHELFDNFKIDKRFKMYFYFVSNIDARVYDRQRIDRVLPKYISKSRYK